MFNILGTSDGHGDLSTLTGSAGLSREAEFISSTVIMIISTRSRHSARPIQSSAITSPSYHAAVAYIQGTYKTIGSSFEFGGLMDNRKYSRKDLMLKYLTFFDMEPISELPETPVGDTIVCANSTSSVYSTQPVPGALYYIWEVEPSVSRDHRGMG